MKYPNIILWGNNTYHRVNSWDFDDKTEAKYLAIGISGTLETWKVFTYTEIMEKTNNQGIPCNDMIDVAKSYSK